MEPLTMSIEEASEMSGFPKSTLYDAARRVNDPLPHVRVGRSIRVHRALFAQWLDRRTVAA